jgi:hypothetical protein
MTQRLSRIVPVLGLATLIAACGGSDGSSTLSVSARLAGAAVAQGGVAASALSVAGGRVEIEEVWIVIRDIKFGIPGVDGEINGGGGPFLLHASGSDLSGPLTESFTVEVPAGTYDELRFVVHKLEDFQSIGVPAVDGPRASLAVKMTIDPGTASEASVTFTSNLNEAQRIFGRFTVADGETPDNVTVSIDPSGWFGTAGSFLDPRVGGNRDAIERNIQGSIDAFEDDDRNGSNDDGPNHT